MKKEKKKWANFKRLFSKKSNKTPDSSIHPPSEGQKARQKEIFVIESSKEETFVVDSESNDVFVIEPTRGETFVIESTEEDTIIPESYSNDIFIIEPTKEYEILGLDADATNAEVKKRYRDLLKKCHPDMGGDPKEFIKIRKAYQRIIESRAEE